MATNWTCPHCNRDQTITDGQQRTQQIDFRLSATKFRAPGLRILSIGCANPDCGEITLQIEFGEGGYPSSYYLSNPLETYYLRPESTAKPQPDFIPQAIREDYAEACRIRDLSPKASATLARRCLQGMIRDFCGVSKPRLIDEIRELRAQLDAGSQPRGVTHESIDALDAVRSVGNIGAHMEKDVNLIVDIEPDEAQMLIDLIEMLFEEWYVERDKRTTRLAGIAALSARKAEELKQAKQALLTADQPPQLLSSLSPLAIQMGKERGD